MEKARIHSLFLAAGLLLSFHGFVIAMEGSGTEFDPYIITNVDELQDSPRPLDEE